MTVLYECLNEIQAIFFRGVLKEVKTTTPRNPKFERTPYLKLI